MRFSKYIKEGAENIKSASAKNVALYLLEGDNVGMHLIATALICLLACRNMSNDEKLVDALDNCMIEIINLLK